MTDRVEQVIDKLTGRQRFWIEGADLLPTTEGALEVSGGHADGDGATVLQRWSVVAEFDGDAEIPIAGVRVHVGRFVGEAFVRRTERFMVAGHARCRVHFVGTGPLETA